MTNNYITNKFQKLAELINMDTEPKRRKNRKDDETLYTNQSLALDYNSIYGGYILIITQKTSGHS